MNAACRSALETKGCRYTQVKCISVTKVAWLGAVWLSLPVSAVQIASRWQPPPALSERHLQYCTVQAYRLEPARRCDALLPPLFTPNYWDFPAAKAFILFFHGNAMVASTPDKKEAFLSQLNISLTFFKTDK